MLSAFIPMMGQAGIFINIALIVLGVGWNFAYSGASTLLAGLEEQQKHRVQGINETVIALFATLGAFLPAPILTSLGWNNANLLALSLTFVVLLVSVHDKFHRALVLSGFFFLKIASTFLNSSFFPKPIKRRIAI
jgi:predicted MFS family arabinose efflux permease